MLSVSTRWRWRKQPFRCIMCCTFRCFRMRLIKHDWMSCYFISPVFGCFVCAIFNQSYSFSPTPTPSISLSQFNMKCDPNAIILEINKVKKGIVVIVVANAAAVAAVAVVIASTSLYILARGTSANDYCLLFYRRVCSIALDGFV